TAQFMAEPKAKAKVMIKVKPKEKKAKPILTKVPQDSPKAQKKANASVGHAQAVTRPTPQALIVTVHGATHATAPLKPKPKARQNHPPRMITQIKVTLRAIGKAKPSTKSAMPIDSSQMKKGTSCTPGSGMQKLNTHPDDPNSTAKLSLIW
ncbi:hypothetical protein, partial [uncultured Marinobacter sp.]|uniref:hypothetical protein n=1 Tax=uncultured Marinobacter sp. TaxID=187379 RepID=UPI002597D4F5